MVLLDRLTDDLPQHQSRAGEDDSDLWIELTAQLQQLERSSAVEIQVLKRNLGAVDIAHLPGQVEDDRSEEHTSELQSPCNLVCRLLLEKKKKQRLYYRH